MVIKIDIEIPVEISIYIALRGITLAEFILEIDEKYKTLSQYYDAERKSLIKRIDRLI